MNIKVHYILIYIDTFGLDDAEMVKKAAEEIEEALKRNKNYKVIFVATLEPERIQPSDLLSISTVCELVKTPFQYGLIFNKVEKLVIEKIKQEGGLDRYLRHLSKQPSSTLLLEKDADMGNAENAYFSTDTETRKSLLNFIHNLRTIKISDKYNNSGYFDNFQGGRIQTSKLENKREDEKEKEKEEEQEEDRKILAKLTIDKYFWRHATKKDIDWDKLTLPKVFYTYPKLKQAEIVAGYYRRLLYDTSCKYGGQLVLARTCYKRNKFEKLLSPEQMGFTRIEPACFQDPSYDKQLIRYLRDGLLTLGSLTVKLINPLMATMEVKNNTNEDIDFIIDYGTALEQVRFRNAQNVVVTHVLTSLETIAGSKKANYTLRDLKSDEGFTARIKANSQETIRLKCQCIDQGLPYPSGQEANITGVKRTQGINENPEENVADSLPNEIPSRAQEILEDMEGAAKNAY